jgi:hypothetical protein
MIPNQSDTNASNAEGILQPTEPQPPNQLPPGNTMADYLQQYIAGLAHLDGHLVFQRWQQEPPNLPAYGMDWCSAGVIRRRLIGIYGATIHHPLGNAGDGYDEMQRHEEFDILCSFYGNNAQYYCDNLIDNLMIWQNKATLGLAGMKFVEIQEPTFAPELIRQQWWNRYDATMVMRRIIRRNYNVFNLLEAAGWVRTPGGYASPFGFAQPSQGPILPPPYEPPTINP